VTTHEVVVVIRFYQIFISWIPKWFWIKCLAEANWNDKHRHFFESFSQCLCQTVPLRDNIIKCHINWVVFRSTRNRKTFSTENKKQAFFIGQVQVVPPWFRWFSSVWCLMNTTLESIMNETDQCNVYLSGGMLGMQGHTHTRTRIRTHTHTSTHTRTHTCQSAKGHYRGQTGQKSEMV
jgi:hypothetical protein